MNPFLAGVLLGVALTIGVFLITGGWLISHASNPQRVDNAADEHANGHGIGGQVGTAATHFGSVSK